MMTNIKIQSAKTDQEILACYRVFKELRPHLGEEEYLAQVKRQMQNHGYQIVFILNDGLVAAAAGFRVAEFLAWGKAFYVDDFIAHSSERRKGYGGALLDFLLEEAKALGCAQFHLDSGAQRYDAHRLYMSRKLIIGGYHFAKMVD